MKNEAMRRERRLVIALAASLWLASGAAKAELMFNFIVEPGTPQEAIDGFAAAGQLWSDIFTDDVVVNIRVGFVDFSTIGGLPDNAIAAAGSDFDYRGEGSYQQVVNALTADASSAADLEKLTFLQPGPDFDRVVNQTLENPNGAGSEIPYVDNDTGANGFNASVFATSANLKALGLLDPNAAAEDGFIQINQNVPGWDFDRSDGISGKDFIGTAAHEIAHILGFKSVIDLLEAGIAENGIFGEDFWIPAIMDLFRFSDDFGLGVPDISIDSGVEYFPLFGGGTAPFCNGISIDCQASHWADDMGLGLMDPSATSNVINEISAIDIEMLDVIGWSLRMDAVPVPEPPMWVLFATGLLALSFARRGRRR